MRTVETSPYEIAERFIGMREIPGSEHNPQVLAMLRLDDSWPGGDEVPWCSAFVNWCFWVLRSPRTKSLRARSWLQIGTPLSIDEATRGFDVVILSRGTGVQPGPEVVDAPGHVGFFSGALGDHVYLLGGNQSDGVNVQRYEASRILGIRRVA